MKGLTLGMSVEDAARVMLGHGLPPGGDAEWPAETFMYIEGLFRHNQTGVRKKYCEAKIAHDTAWLEAAVASGTVTSLLEHLTSILGQGYVEDNKYSVEYFVEENSLDDIPSLVAKSPYPLLPETERFPKLKDYVAEHYPDGPPYRHGGLWDGDVPLRFDDDGALSGPGWEFVPDDEGRIVRMDFEPHTVDGFATPID